MTLENRLGLAFAIDVRTSAFLLDVDGTLLDIAPRPLDVVVPDRLRTALARLREQTGGAAAFVSGRPISQLDLLFEPLRFPAVGGHGSELRINGGQPPIRLAASIDSGLRRQLAAFAETLEGVLLEDKGYSLALHYRLAPQHAATVREAVAAACAPYPQGALDILVGKAVIEVKPAAFDKGSGVRELMRSPPFRGRRPIFIGDDITDEAAFNVLPELDGFGFSVGREIPGLAGLFRTPAEVRRWLYDLTDSDRSAS